MKISKWIPTLSVSAATIVAPITLSSCHPEYVEPIQMFDIKTYEEGSVEPHAEDFWNQTSATYEYIKAVNANPNIFYDDTCLAMKSMISPTITNANGDIYTLDSLNFGVTKPKFGYTIISRYGSSDIEYSTITAQQKMFATYSFASNNQTRDVWNIELNVWYKDVVFYAYENEELGEGWNLGLFDYNVGYESLWPFISNLNPWSISFSCRSVQSLYSTATTPETLINNRSSYYSANVNSGTKLINLLNYYKSLDPQPTDPNYMYELLEWSALRVMLVDYKSNYLKKIQNIPEIRLTQASTCEYSKSNPPEILTLSGMVLICPTWLDKDDDNFGIKIAEQVEFNKGSHEEPIGQTNKITIEKDAKFTIGESAGSQFRFQLTIPGKLAEYWDSSLIEPGMNIYLTTPLKSVKIDLYYDFGSPIGEKHWIQDLPLPYNFCVNKIVE